MIKIFKTKQGRYLVQIKKLNIFEVSMKFIFQFFLVNDSIKCLLNNNKKKP